eukprot:TRINITY_DN18770_c0_g2_i1.p1 TRINITY_DN18770_c0_g2~~TRINITY_DN18770_c0_g2_i1.p1  ORF type:complete len:311 (-),score=19.58 TRINITY_DN18770_c0_g2_i1:680-1612(-)
MTLVCCPSVFPTDKRWLLFVLFCVYGCVAVTGVIPDPAQASHRVTNSRRAPKPGKAALLKPEASVELVGCSRIQTRAAQRVIHEYLAPLVVREKYDLPRTCKLHPANDMFQRSENAKQMNHHNSWRCRQCFKQFKGEQFLDQHMDNRHLDLVEKELGCLSDICPLIHCSHAPGPGRPRHKSHKKMPKCKKSEQDKLRHSCEALAESCFPPEAGVTARRLNVLFKHQFCDAHTCEPHPMFPLGGRWKWTTIYYAAAFLMVFLLLLYYTLFYLTASDVYRPGQLHRTSVRPHKINAWTRLQTLLRWKRDKQF